MNDLNRKIMIKYEVEVYYDGTRIWHLDGERHREDGPAWECFDGSKAWYRHGKIHREDGPAVIRADGTTMWFIDGIPLSKRETARREAELQREKEQKKDPRRIIRQRYISL